MTKTKEQLRAEAVERLKDAQTDNLEWMLLGDECPNWVDYNTLSYNKAVRERVANLLTDDDSTISEDDSTAERGMTNLEWLYEHDEYFNSFAKLIAFLRGFATDEFTANEWLMKEHSESNPDCSAMLYWMFTENMKHEPCSDYEPKDGVVAILREAARNLSDYHDAGEALRQLTDTWNVYHALVTLADMVERDYVRRDSIDEVMDNDRALVEENSMLAGELLKLRAELEKATDNLNSANEDFENARAELTAERDELKEEIAKYEHDCGLLFDEKHKLTADAQKWADAANAQRLMAIEQADEVQELTAERNEWKAKAEGYAEALEKLGCSVLANGTVFPPPTYNEADSRVKLEADIERYLSQAGCHEMVCGWLDRQAAITQHEITERWAEHLHPIERECGDLRRKVAELTADNDRLAKLLSKSLEEEYDILEAERDELKAEMIYRSKFGKCLDYADVIHTLIDDEGLA